MTISRKWHILLIVIPLVTLLIFILKGSTYESAFGILGWVKNFSGKSVNIDDIYTVDTTPPDHNLWDELLQSHVSRDGWVNYEGFNQDSVQFNNYLEMLGERPPSHSWNMEDELAYWVNAYNAFTIKLILDHYPLESIKDIAGSVPMINSPWDIQFFKIGGTPLDLNTIEHDILRKKIGDPRIHFAINCASISCPLLRNEAFTADKIHQQLDKQATLFINDTSRNKLSISRLQLSPIFNWFKNDFEKDQSLAEYINKYSDIEISPNADIEWLEYNWGLNKKDQ